MSKFTDLGNNIKDENTSHQEHIEGGMPQPIRPKKKYKNTDDDVGLHVLGCRVDKKKKKKKILPRYSLI